ncbi:cytidylate kinase-like family protein [Christensenellaceae bacterium OttesenSCG-928-K19]|nr:cytidylate kinase-like family protein [Christensenellaceae bacterium OttesenSCG-928-K19]
MSEGTIITLGRQFGSGGREIGRMLAQRMDVPFYDRDLIRLAAEESGYNSEVLESADEKATNIFLQSFATTAYTAGSRISLPTEISLNDKLFFAQADVIKKAAEKGPCVIVGRCADYILRDRSDCLNVFIHAPLETRIERVMNLYKLGLTYEEAKNTILKTDKKRANYYNYYSNKEWNSIESYDLTLNCDATGIEGTVETIIEVARRRQQNRE